MPPNPEDARLVRAARKAIDAVMSDVSIEAAETLEQMLTLREHVQMNIDALREDLS